MEDDEKREETESTGKGVFKTIVASKILLFALAILFILIILIVLFSGSVLAFTGGDVSLFETNLNGGRSNSLAYNPNNLRCSEEGFAICYTSFSKEEFKEKISEYAKKHPNAQVFADYADDYYDYAVSVQVNPELVIIVAHKESYTFTPTGKNNYWGYGCSNTGGGKDCENYDSFMEGAKKFIDNAANSSSLVSWFVDNTYSYIGDYWYNPGDSGMGGCYYASYIYDPVPDRVKDACAKGKECSGSSCVPTNKEDQEAYANYLVKVMADFRYEVFGLKQNEGGINSTIDPSIEDADVATIIKWDQKTAWKNIIGFETTDRHPNVSESTMDARMTTISVPIRKWKSGSGNNPRTDTEKVMDTIKVNKAIAKVWKAFFEDVYENAPTFVINSLDGCYEYRNITNGTTLSPHAYGVACDINANTYGNGFGDRPSMSSSEWEKLEETRQKYQIVYKGSPVVEIAHKYTLINGSDWSDGGYDAMHFSFISDWPRDKSISCQGKSYCG